MQEFSMPLKFVWTKFGTESGEPVAEIFARKERERVASGGIFLWGIGNNVGQSIRALARDCSPEVVFSPIASAPRRCDSNPESVVRWTAAESLDGEYFQIPRGTVVKSRWNDQRRHHFALICYSEVPIEPRGDDDVLYADSLRNLVSGRKVGSSQVTSVVKRIASKSAGRAYPMVLRIKLASPYLVRLSNPMPFEVQLDQRNVTARGARSYDLFEPGDNCFQPAV